jgi:hypothetical protein
LPILAANSDQIVPHARVLLSPLDVN